MASHNDRENSVDIEDDSPPLRHNLSNETTPLLNNKNVSADTEEGEDNPSSTDQTRTIIQKLTSPHILWMIPFAFCLSFIMYSILAPSVQLIMQLICLEYYSNEGNVDVLSSVNLGVRDDEDKCLKPEILVLTSKFLMWYQICSYVAVTLSVGYLSALSDRKGRRFVFLLSTAGIILQLTNTIFVAHYWQIVGTKLLFLGATIDGVFGGVIAINTACHAYISDCTQPSDRSVAFGYMHAAAFCGMTVGPVFGGFISKYSLLLVFYIALGAQILFFLFNALILPESLSLVSRQQRSPTTGSLNIFSALLILKQKPLESFPGERASCRGRNTIYLLAVIYFLYRVSQASLNEIFVLYAANKFRWTSIENGFFFSLQAFTRVFASLVLLQFCLYIHNRLHLSTNIRSGDLSVLRLGMLLEIVSFILFATATVPKMFYFACVINALATIASPAIRSLFTTFFLPTQAGQILGALSVIESVGSILSPVWMNPLYSWGVKESFGQVVFWSNAGVFVVAIFLGFLVW